MAYKLIAIDLDDTLLDEAKNITPKNKEAIRRAIGVGVSVVLASGRAYDSIKPFKDELNLHGFTIASCGGQLIDDEGNTVYSTYVPHGKTREIIDWARSNDVYVQVYFEDGCHYPYDSPFRKIYERNSGISSIHDPSVMGRDDLHSYKVLFVDTPERAAQIKEEAILRFPDLTIQTSQADYVEILNPITSKGDALLKLSSFTGIDIEGVIAIGDSEIDMSMLRCAGLGVAVSNAVPDVLKIASYIAPSNIEDGVAHVIDKFILNAD